GYEYPVCVHWYSGDTDTLKKYIDMGCYFTLGPDTAVSENSCISYMLKHIPYDRIMVETDGADAVRWALENAGVAYESRRLIITGISDTVKCLADVRGVPEYEIRKITAENFMRFSGIRKV
ncbi:MAG: TatD family hydrolase, partial [Parasporobacterium sp.]|nr:TatD family hydrolase [Parasporobacterium sp.]